MGKNISSYELRFFYTKISETGKHKFESEEIWSNGFAKTHRGFNNRGEILNPLMTSAVVPTKNFECTVFD